MNHKAIEAIEAAAMMCISDEPSYRGTPGKAVSRLPKVMREELKKLTSEDTMKMRLFSPPISDSDVTLFGRPIIWGSDEIGKNMKAIELAAKKKEKI